MKFEGIDDYEERVRVAEGLRSDAERVPEDPRQHNTRWPLKPDPLGEEEFDPFRSENDCSIFNPRDPNAF